MNIICGLGLLPWLYHFYNIVLKNRNTFHKFIPLFIFVNGFTYHIFYPTNSTMYMIDTTSNIFFILYINLTTYNQPETFFCTMIAMATYSFNNLFNQDWLHVVFVQWLLLFAYIKSYNYEYEANMKYIELSKKVDVYKVLEFVYQLLDKYAENVLRIEYDDLFISINKRVRNSDDFTDEARNDENPNIIQEVTAETESPSNELAMRSNDHKLRHE
jgi:hypothetical protein